MSDLDKAIRAELETGYWRLSRQTSTAADKGARVILGLLDEHKPIGIYDECGHSHHPEEPGVKEIDDVGLVCAEGLTYEVCAACCEWTPLGGQTEHCASEHDHHWGGTHCMVVYSISESLGVSGEDRSEPTPAPGDMVRLWVGGKEGTVVGELVLIADGDDPAREYVRAHADGREWLVAPNGQRRRVEVLPAGVSPEGTP